MTKSQIFLNFAYLKTFYALYVKSYNGKPVTKKSVSRIKTTTKNQVNTMKKLFLLFGLLLLMGSIVAQVPDMRTKLIYDSVTCRYAVYAIPSVSASTFNLGGSQIVIAVPHDVITNYPTTRRSAFVITTVAPITNNWVITAWADKDVLPTYSGPFDYYAVDNNGGALGALIANQDLLLFYFTLGENCINGIRLWEGIGAVPNNYNDPTHPVMGGDFVTNLSEASTIPFDEAWVGNIANVPTVLPLPIASISSQDNFPFINMITLTANAMGGAGCNGYGYQWSGTGVWLVPPGATPSGIVQSPGMGIYTVDIKDNNGCQASATITLPLVPVELVSFIARRENSVVVLDWTTTTEVNNNYFDVQYAADGLHFEPVGRVFSADRNSTEAQKYQYRHMHPVAGINYYRLKQVDADGAYTYTDIRSVVFGSETGITVYPNPARDILQVRLDDVVDENAIIEIMNFGGQVLCTVQSTVWDGNLLTIDLQNIAAGSYFLRVRYAGNVYRERFLVAR